MPTLTLRVDHQLDQKLRRLAKETEQPKSYFIKKALDLYLEEYEDYQIAWPGELIRMMKPWQWCKWGKSSVFKVRFKKSVKKRSTKTPKTWTKNCLCKEATNSSSYPGIPETAVLWGQAEGRTPRGEGCRKALYGKTVCTVWRRGAGHPCPLWSVVGSCVETFENGSRLAQVLYSTHTFFHFLSPTVIFYLRSAQYCTIMY